MTSATSDLTSVFDTIYESNTWTHSSGPGSLAIVNRPLIDFLNDFIRANHVSSMCDFGCGDWQYMRHVDLGLVKYHGFDVSDRILASNASTFASPNVRFLKTPDDLCSLPDVDCFLTKDTLMHLPNQYVKTLLDVVRKKCRFLISVSNAIVGDCPNCDIEAGQFRMIDLSLPPFSMKIITLFEYGQVRVLDPAYPSLISKILRRYTWPGRKSVQFIPGDLYFAE